MLALPLNDGHDRQGFDCGDADLNRWLQQTARQHKEKGVSSTFVAVTVPSSPGVLGYYAVSLPELTSPDLPSRHRMRLPLKVPAFRLGRLATSVLHRGQGIGEHLQFDAICHRPA